MITYPRICTRAEAERVRDAIAERFGAHPSNWPELLPEGFDDRQWTIAWDGDGMYPEWTMIAIWAIKSPPGCHLDAVSYGKLAIGPGAL